MTAPSPAVAKKIKRTHDDMAKFLIDVCKFSDSFSRNYRGCKAEEHYQTARKLIRRAGFKYEPRNHD